MNNHLCTALIVASDDPEARTTFHEFSGRIWAFCKRNANSRNAIIHYRTTKKKKLIAMEQYRNTKSKSNTKTSR